MICPMCKGSQEEDCPVCEGFGELIDIPPSPEVPSSVLYPQEYHEYNPIEADPADWWKKGQVFVQEDDELFFDEDSNNYDGPSGSDYQTV